MNNARPKIKLILPNKLDYIPLGQSIVREMAVIMGYKKSEILKIELATEEAISNIIEHSFAPGEETSFDLIIEPNSNGIKIYLKDKGIPFDPSEIPEYNPENHKEVLSAKGLGSFLIKEFVDELTYLNLGKEGKEIILFKYLNNKSILDVISESDIKKAKKERQEAKLPKGSVKYSVRKMHQDEAVDVSKCAYTTYGYTYVHEDIYFPERVREMNNNGELVSYVSVAENGEIMGHVALEIEERDIGMPQLGMAFVNPKYQGQGCMKVQSELMIDDAKNQKLCGIYARGITTHPYSQRVIGKFGFNDTAIFLSSGVERDYKGISEGDSKRESVVIIVRYLHPPKNLIIYPPKNHKNIIKRIYNNIGLEPNIKDISLQEIILNHESVIKITTDNVNFVGFINVIEYGKDIVEKVNSSLKELCNQRYETIYLKLKLCDLSTSKYSPEFEKMNFFFAGIMPGSENKDELILQYLNNYIIDYDKVVINSEFGNELKEYIKSKDPYKK